MFYFTHILASENDKSFTYLNRYDKKTNQFEGEHSIIHNECSADSYFLSKFLVEHIEQPLILLNSENDKFKSITNEYKRFQEQDIHKYIEEKVLKRKDDSQSLQMDKNLGQLQLAIVKGLMEKQLKSIRDTKAETPADHQVLLGKELSLQWVLHTIDDVIKRGQY